jgi:hypothetical protein
MKNINLDTILDSAVKQINKEYAALQQFLIEEESTLVGYFTNRVLSWYGDKRKKQLLWEMFHKAIDIESPVLFMGSLHSFVVNCLLDDSAFRIEWRKNYVDENHNLVWENGGHRTILSSKEDPDSFPIVLWDNDGKQNVHLLMEAMDEVELREDRRQKEYEKDQDIDPES